MIVATALEGFVHTDRFHSTRQFLRVSRLAGDVGLPSFTEADAADAYELRSTVAHGSRLASVTATFPEARIVQLDLALEAILGAAIRRAIEDATFCAIFADDALIRSRWPI